VQSYAYKSTMLTSSSLRYAAVGLCLIGLGLSTYMFVVRDKYTHDKKFLSHFDFSHFWSCSKHCSSKYAVGFGLVSQYLGEKSPLNLSNGFFCMIFYVAQILLVGLSRVVTVFPALAVALVANLVSAYMTYVNFFVVKSMCPPYMAICAVDVLLIIVLVTLALRTLMPRGTKKTMTSEYDMQQKKKFTKKDK